MTKPRPLKSIPYRGPDQQLTPRTPHSGNRTSRLEQGFSKLPLSEANNGSFYDEQEALQTSPLLASSTSARFSGNVSARSRRNKKKKGKSKAASKDILLQVVARSPLVVGVFSSTVLLIFIVISFMKPEALHKYVGAKAPSAPASPAKAKESINHENIHTSTVDKSSSQSIVIHQPTTTHIPVPDVRPVEAPKPVKLITYENYTQFPLQPKEYLKECNKQHAGFMPHGAFWDISPMGSMDVKHDDTILEHEKICSSSITYMLDGTVGLLADLALMAQAATLAHEKNRTFFVDDTYWNRGKWLDHFDDVRSGQPGPEPGCRPPPPDEWVACPRTARHWVINARTAKFHFGHPFSNQYEDAYARQLNRLRPIYESAGESLDSVIFPNEENMELIQMARKEFTEFLRNANKRKAGFNETSFVATHIRRGDRKSASYVFPDRKIPLQEYLDGVGSTWNRLHTSSKSGSSHINPVVYLATDSPDAHDEFTKAYKGEVFSLYDSINPELQSLASPEDYYQAYFDDFDIHKRKQATRGMIVDFAIVSGFWRPEESDIQPDAIVCAISSSICNLAAVGIGWEKAFGHVDEMGNIDENGKAWTDIDNKGAAVPVWRAFEMF